jgi:hypothetical protein
VVAVLVGAVRFGCKLAQAVIAFFVAAVCVVPGALFAAVAVTPCSVRQLRYAAKAALFALPPAPAPAAPPGRRPAGRRLAQAVIAFWKLALPPPCGRAGRDVVDVPVVDVGGAPPPPPPPPPAGSVTPCCLRQVVNFAVAALLAPAAAVVPVEVAVALVAVVDADPLLPPQAAAARAVARSSAASAPRWASGRDPTPDRSRDLRKVRKDVMSPDSRGPVMTV